MFAEVFSYLVMNGYDKLENKDSVGYKAKSKVLESVIERMQAALFDSSNTGVDVSTWMQYVTMYVREGFTPDLVSPEEVILAEVSPLDASFFEDPRTIVGNSNKPADRGELLRFKAIEVSNGNDRQYVYANYDALKNELYVYIQFGDSGSLPDGIDESVRKYLQAISPNGEVSRAESSIGAVYYISFNQK